VKSTFLIFFAPLSECAEKLFQIGLAHGNEMNDNISDIDMNVWDNVINAIEPVSVDSMDSMKKCSLLKTIA
jgi:hypothetical protein